MWTITGYRVCRRVLVRRNLGMADMGMKTESYQIQPMGTGFTFQECLGDHLERRTGRNPTGRHSIALAAETACKAALRDMEAFCGISEMMR